MRKFLFLTMSVLLSFAIQAQDPEDVQTESGILEYGDDTPIDDVVERKLVEDRMVLPYESVREADILWSKKVWRVLDVREKMNLPFAYPELPFFTILVDGLLAGDIKAYSTEDDKFTYQLAPEDIQAKLSKTDTIYSIDPDTYEETLKVVTNDLNPEDVKRYRIKEIWYFDNESSVMKVRTLGIAPIINSYDDQGNFRFEMPMFWVYYPNCRDYLAQHTAYNYGGNDASQISWEDLIEMRFFSSYVIKESNVYDRKVNDYLTGVDALLESQNIKDEIFNWEQDLWSY